MIFVFFSSASSIESGGPRNAPGAASNAYLLSNQHGLVIDALKSEDCLQS